MNATEVLEVLKSIGLQGSFRSTGSPDWLRIFIIDPQGVTQGRVNLFEGRLYTVKWYVRGAANGSQILPDEYWPHAWQWWVERREQLTREHWQDVMAFAYQQATEERAQKQAWRDANPKRGKRNRLQLNVRKYIMKGLYPERFTPSAHPEQSSPGSPCID